MAGFCTPGKGTTTKDSADVQQPAKKRPDFDATNDKGLLAKIKNEGLTQSKLPPVTDELIKQQAEHAANKPSKTCTGSLCPVIRFFVSSLAENPASHPRHNHTLSSYPTSCDQAQKLKVARTGETGDAQVFFVCVVLL